MTDEYISNPRPVWREEELEETPTKRVITLGTKTSGMVIRFTKKGVEFNGYYAGFNSGKKCANVRGFLEVSWDDFDTMRENVFKKRPLNIAQDRVPDKVDETPDQEYLEALPKVTLNGKKYYIDMDRKERRPVDKPHQVYNFEKQASEEC